MDDGHITTVSGLSHFIPIPSSCLLIGYRNKLCLLEFSVAIVDVKLIIMR